MVRPIASARPVGPRTNLLRKRLVEVGVEVVRHGRCVTARRAKVVVPGRLFAEVLWPIGGLRAPPVPASETGLQHRRLWVDHAPCRTGHPGNVGSSHSNPAQAIGSGTGMTDPILIADIGGTNARFALLDEAGHGTPHSVPLAGFTGIAAAIAAFLAGQDRTPREAVLAVAGPVMGNRVRLTNRGWWWTAWRSPPPSALGACAW